MQFEFKKTLQDEVHAKLAGLLPRQVARLAGVRLTKAERHRHYQEQSGKMTTIAGYRIIRDEDGKFSDEVRAQAHVGGCGTVARKF